MCLVSYHRESPGPKCPLELLCTELPLDILLSFARSTDGIESQSRARVLLRRAVGMFGLGPSRGELVVPPPQDSYFWSFLQPRGATLLLIFLILLKGCVLGCRLSEFTCGNYACIPADAFCDGTPDCDDRTDEPKDCSTCNRTFYGDAGRSYEVSVKRPRDMLTTFTCHLTFVADGKDYGDIVQIVIQDFKLGDFFSYNSGCPQGWMQISERDRPYSDGYWCGDGQGFNVYYSETSTVTITLKKFIPMDYIHFEGLMQSPFKFRLTYKTLRHRDATLRYGTQPKPKNRGELAPGSICDRIFQNCDERLCAVQSPNFPGLYPRHVTCHYLIRQTRYVPYARPLITITQ
ncbi:unnamed protein product, partial [Meganyctiphanes norvegica]